MSDLLPDLELPNDSPRGGTESFRPGHVSRRLGSKVTDDVFTTLLSAYAILLYRLSGQEDFVIGVPAADNGGDWLPLRFQMDEASSVAEHMELVQRNFQTATRPQRMPRISATFGVQKNCDLGVAFRETNGELTLDCTYNADLFRADTITRWLGHFETVLQNMMADSAQPVAGVRLLSAAEWQQIVVDWNKTALEFPRETLMHELFEAQVERTPDAVAAIFRRQEITYRELNRQANQLAHHLKSLGVGPEILVGLCVDRSFALLVGILGILKAGGAYVPLDWTYPAERVRFMLDDAQAPVVVTQQKVRQIGTLTNARMVCLDTEVSQIGTQDTSNPARAGHSANLAYVMYTSGSTGRAKGVALEHRSAVSFIHWAREAFSAQELKAVLASTSICFDLSIFEIFVPLSWGGTVVLADNAVDVPASEITLINTVPSAIRDLLKAGTIPLSVTVVNLAGEKLATQTVQQLYARPHIQKVYDLYGPSEATTYATWTLRTAKGLAVIGRPLANTQVYILDGRMQPCPIGVVGEIYIGGDCLARGYLNRPELTAERFVADPFSKLPGARLYKTGDLGRYLADGNIEFIGRRDHQVKIRGYRIELGEIEAVLAQHPEVQECVAVAREDIPERKQIVGYLVPAPGARLNGSEVRRFLRERLPEYMVPTVLVTLAGLPLMPNGKVNRAGLPAPTQGATLADDENEIVTVTPVEEALMEIWREVIGVEKVGLQDDFFDLGGHSVLVAQITSRVRQVFEVELSMRHLFGAPTVSALARVVEGLLDEELQSLSEEELQQLAAGAAKEGL
jgi:amino acid adenylation domain-containing protein